MTDAPHPLPWDYKIMMFDPKGRHLLTTVHRGQTSRDIEILACKSRMTNGEIGRIEVISITADEPTQTIYPERRP